jgi:hypothetical protein
MTRFRCCFLTEDEREVMQVLEDPNFDDLRSVRFPQFLWADELPEIDRQREIIEELHEHIEDAEAGLERLAQLDPSHDDFYLGFEVRDYLDALNRELAYNIDVLEMLEC